MSPKEASIRGRIGAYALHASHDARDTTRAARAAFLGRFSNEVDPHHKLPADEREKRAGFAKKAYFAKLSLASARARRVKRGGGDDA